MFPMQEWGRIIGAGRKKGAQVGCTSLSNTDQQYIGALS